MADKNTKSKLLKTFANKDKKPCKDCENEMRNGKFSAIQDILSRLGMLSFGNMCDHGNEEEFDNGIEKESLPQNSKKLVMVRTVTIEPKNDKSVPKFVELLTGKKDNKKEEACDCNDPPMINGKEVLVEKPTTVSIFKDRIAKFKARKKK